MWNFEWQVEMVPVKKIIKEKSDKKKKATKVEIIAEFLHNIWANWYAHQRDNSTEENILRWEMQSKTLYEDLAEEDKEKDRKLARVLYKELFDVTD